MGPLEKIREHSIELQNGYHVAKLGVFGSFARGEATEASDVDILVEFDETVDLFHFVRLQRYLSEILGKEVDLVTPDALKPLIKEQVLRDVLYL